VIVDDVVRIMIGVWWTGADPKSGRVLV